MPRPLRTIYGLKEIRALRWQCRNCGAAVSHPVGFVRLTRSCPACNADAFDPDFKPQLQVFQNFLGSLKELLEFEKKHPNFSGVELEFDAPSTATSGR